MKEQKIKSFDKTDIHCYIWDDVKDPVGIVQIIHGMQEHAGRPGYDAFAKFLNKNGYIVFADDHRAHGKTPSSIDLLGKYDGGNLFYDILQDEMFFSKMLKTQYEGLPLYVFGHSFGSFILQNYIQSCTLYTKAIICGSANMKGQAAVKIGRPIAKWVMKYKGEDKIAVLIEKIMKNTYQGLVKTGSWLNTDEKEVELYYQDPYCGTPFSARFYYDFFTGLKHSYNKQSLQKINHKKPILLISGKDDPVGGMGKLVVKLFRLYHEEDLNVSMKLYENARHEILNEPIKNIVYEDILAFLQKPFSLCGDCGVNEATVVAPKKKAKTPAKKSQSKASTKKETQKA